MSDRQSLTYVELDILFCDHVYGIAPCQAVLGVTGDIKCFNSRKTCQDIANFTASEVTLRFAIDSEYLPKEIFAYPFIKDIDYEPATISLGTNLGQRASVKITFQDHPHNDTGDGFDKYLSERPYNALDQGTFFGKLRARQPFLRGRDIRIIFGEIGQSISTMETRHFVVESFDGPTPEGEYILIAKDILKLTDGDRAQAPALSQGFLTSNITETQTSLDLSPAGIGLTYPLASGFANIGGNEIVSFEAEDLYTTALMHFENSGDVAFNNAVVPTGVPAGDVDWAPVGNAAYSTLQAKFGTGSVALDGTTDYIRNADFAAPYVFGAEDFTIEMWLFRNVLGTLRTLYDGRPAATNGLFPTIRVTAGNVLEYFTDSAVRITGTTVLTTNVWHAIALSRVSGVTRLFLNGVQEGSDYADTNIYINTSAARPTVGADGNSLGANSVNGFIDELRISKGIGRYSGTYTPATEAFQNEGMSDDWFIVRGQRGSTATTHNAEDRIQLCLEYDSERASDIIYDLLVTYASVDPSFISLATWQSEDDLFLGNLYSALIAEPVGVDKLISELVEQSASSVWYDDKTQSIKFQILRQVSATANLFNQDNIIKDSFETLEQPEKRISQVWTYFAKKDSTKPHDNLDNYRSTVVTVDTEAEANYEVPIIKKIQSRWIDNLGSAIAENLNNKILARYRDPPRRFNFGLMRKAETDVELGGGYQLQWWTLQDETGAADTVPVQITRVEATNWGYKVEAEELIAIEEEFTSPFERIIIIDVDTNSFNLRDAYDSLYSEPLSGYEIVCIIQSGVTVGSTDNSIPAFNTGTWPAGVTVNIRMQANSGIQGSGGDGGAGGGTGAGQAGQAGGIALRVQVTTRLEFLAASAKLWGGGGAGGGGANSGFSVVEGGGGGGGGAGVVGGIGGNSFNGIDGNPGTETAGGTGGLGGSETGATRGGTGGTGGGPGLAGAAGGTVADGAGGAGGAAGQSINGISFVTKIGTADQRGSEV